LYNIATSQGSIVRFDSCVAAVDAHANTVILKSGETVSGDVIVGADGAFGVVREAILGYPTSIPAVFMTYVYVSGTPSRSMSLKQH
jgi:2-polyprenyl-6-methoxyphenol hydroxylase-like FAD-dependent oxidoreductase